MNYITKPYKYSSFSNLPDLARLVVFNNLGALIKSWFIYLCSLFVYAIRFIQISIRNVLESEIHSVASWQVNLQQIAAVGYGYWIISMFLISLCVEEDLLGLATFEPRNLKGLWWVFWSILYGNGCLRRFNYVCWDYLLSAQIFNILLVYIEVCVYIYILIKTAAWF